jgi:hypothetical protein
MELDNGASCAPKRWEPPSLQHRMAVPCLYRSPHQMRVISSRLVTISPARSTKATRISRPIEAARHHEGSCAAVELAGKIRM